MQVSGKFSYDEMRLDEAGSPSDRRSARFYREAQAEIKIDKQSDRPQLRDDRRLMLVKTGKNGVVISSPRGPLTREELDLVDLPGNSLLLDELLPDKSVKVGDRWKPADSAVVGLLSLDAVSQSGVQCTLTGVNDKLAAIAISGPVDGAIGGVATEIELEGTGQFDLEHRRLISIQLRIKERRSAGHVSPGLDVVAQLKVDIAPLAGSDKLTPELILARSASEGVGATKRENTPSVTDASISPPLMLRNESGGFELLYDRRWHITRETPDLTVLRLVDRGELVAQCNLSPLPPLPAEKTVTLEEFQADVRQSLGKLFGQVESAAEGKTSAGVRVLKLVVAGTASDLPIQWRYYLLIDDQGHRAALAFTLEEKLADRFADADATMFESLAFLPLPPAEAKK